MIDFRWLSDSLCDVLRWQRANPGGEDGPEVPIVGRRVWSIFLGLDATRTVGMAANPISFGEIEVYSRVRREPVRPFEVTMLRALDRAYLEAARADKASRHRRRVTRKNRPAKSSIAKPAAYREIATAQCTDRALPLERPPPVY